MNLWNMGNGWNRLRGIRLRLYQATSLMIAILFFILISISWLAHLTALLILGVFWKLSALLEPYTIQSVNNFLAKYLDRCHALAERLHTFFRTTPKDSDYGE